VPWSRLTPSSGQLSIFVDMHRIDQPEEWRRLEELYAEMSEGELQGLLEKVEDLTGLAQQALKAEMARRGREAQASDAPVEEPLPPEDELVDAWRAGSLSEAHSVKQILEYAGISCCTTAHHVEGVERSMEGSGDSIKVKVMPRDYERARNAIYPYYSELHAAYPASAPNAQEERDYAARCPKCGCADIVFECVNAEADGAPGADQKSAWSCDACGYKWQDDGNEEKY